MNAVERALERGREAVASDRAKAKFEPVGVENRGWMVARVRDLRSGEVEGVYYAQGSWQFYAISRRSDGKAYCADVRDSQLKRCAKAMLYPGSAPGNIAQVEADDERSELIRECAANKPAKEA